MPAYKCEFPGCNKFFSSQAKKRQHEQRVHATKTPEANPAKVIDLTTKKSPEVLKIKKPNKKEGGFHCLDCGHTLTKGQNPCPSCGESLAWPEESPEVDA